MPVTYKKIEDTLVVAHRIHGNIEDLPEVFEKLKEASGEASTGHPVVVQHWPLTDKEGRTMEVCVPVSGPIDSDEFETMTLVGGVAATALHRGPYKAVNETYSQLIPDVYKHGHPIQENGREVFLNLDLEEPENTAVEIQAMIIDWDRRLCEHLEKVLGEKRRDLVLKGFSRLDLETGQAERSAIIKEALQKLDEVATDDQKYEALSLCGHEFPTELIADMRALYRKTKSIGTVIDAMKEGHFFYPKLRREGNILYDRKGPARKKAFDKAETREERMRATCFCPLLKDVWDEMPWTFCYCAAGWQRRLIEGIIEQPVRVEVVKALTKGDDYCEFAIHLPAGVT
jgi:effector-binding domain-containing protein